MQRLLICGLALCLANCARDPEVPRAALFGKVDPQGHAPSRGNDVTLIHAESGERVVQQTDDSGAFRFPGLAAGTYSIKLAIPGFAPLNEGPWALRGTDLDVGVLTPAWLAPSASDATISGRVVVASSNDGGAADAFGASVRFLSQDTNNTPIDQVAVDRFGNFTNRLPPGLYTLEASHPYYVTASRTDVLLAEGQRLDLSAQPFVLELNPAEVRGQVLLEVDNDVATQPAVGARVSADTGLRIDTDANGRFVLGGLAAGTRTLTITFDGHHDSLPGRTLRLGAGENVVLAPITLLLDRGNLTGEVSMGDGTPLQQVTVELPGTTYNANATQLAATPQRGRYTIRDVPVGDYDVRASRPNYLPATSAPVRVRANQPVAVNLLTLARLQGDFSIDDGDPSNTAGFTRVRDVTLQITSAANTASYRTAEGSAGNLASATWVPFTGSTVAFQLSAGDGPKTIYLQLRDASMIEGQPLTATIVLDQTPPTSVTFQLSGGADFSRVANPILSSLSGLDQGSGLAFFRMQEGPSDGGALSTPRQPYLRDSSFTRSTSSDGLQVVLAELIDNAGNVSAVVQDQVVIDTIAPMGSITITRGAEASGDGYTREALVQLAATSMAEPLGGFVQVKLANDLTAVSTATIQAFSANAIWALEPSEGLKTLHYRFVDGAGNEGMASTATIRLDRTAPVIAATLTSPSPSGSLVTSISLALTEAHELSPTAGLTLSESAVFTGATSTGYPSNNLAQFTFSAGDGNRELFVRVRDAAGNEGTTSVQVIVDQTPPTNGVLTLTGALGDGSASTTLTSVAQVTVSSSVTGATGILLGPSTLTCPATVSSYTVWNGAPITGFALPGTGTTRIVAACFIDAAGNVRGPLTASIELDTVPPITGPGALAINNGAAATSSPTVTLALAAIGATRMKLHVYEQPSGAGGACSTAPTMTNADFATDAELPFAASLAFVLPPSETQATECKWVGVRFTDAAGNSSNITSNEVSKILLDTVAPAAPQLDTVGQVTTASTIDVLLSSNAVDRHLTKYQALFAGATAWVDVLTSGTTPPFQLAPTCVGTTSPLCSVRVALLANTGAITPNKENLILLRGVDLAGNASTAASITVVRDHADPTPPTSLIATPGDSRVSLTWNASTAPDVAGYQVRYLSFPGTCPTDPNAYVGSFAAQGVSPIDVGRNRALVLTGVPNGVELCVLVQVYDATQFPGRRVSTGVVTRVTPFEVAPNLRARLSAAHLGLGPQERVGAVAVRNGLLYAATTQGLKELDVSNEDCFDLSAPEFPSCVGLLTSSTALTDPRDLVLHGRYAYVADGAGGLKIFRITEGTAPAFIRTVSLFGVTSVRAVAASGNLIAVAHSTGFALMTMTSPNNGSNPQVSRIERGLPDTFDVDLQGSWMMLARSPSTANMFFDVSTPATPQQTATAPCDLGAGATAVKLSGRSAYFLTSDYQLEICGLSSTLNPRPVGSSSSVAGRGRVELYGPYAYSTGVDWSIELSGYYQYLDVTDVSNKAAPRFVGRFSPPSTYVSSAEQLGSLAAEGNRVFLASAATPTIEVLHVGEPRSFELVATDQTILGSADTRAIKDQLIVPQYSATAPETLASFRHLGVTAVERPYSVVSNSATVVTDTDYVTFLEGAGHSVAVPRDADALSKHHVPQPMARATVRDRSEAGRQPMVVRHGHQLDVRSGRWGSGSPVRRDSERGDLRWQRLPGHRYHG